MLIAVLKVGTYSLTGLTAGSVNNSGTTASGSNVPIFIVYCYYYYYYWGLG